MSAETNQVAVGQIVRDVPVTVTTVLDAHVAQDAVKVPHRHVECLGHLRSRQRVLRAFVHHFQRTPYDGIGSINNLFSRELSPIDILRGDVATRLSNLWQHLRSHPVIESLGLWQLRRENQGVEA